eukprot:Clim_evm24s211 gene=Clim_evmTU24s211
MKCAVNFGSSGTTSMIKICVAKEQAETTADTTVDMTKKVTTMKVKMKMMEPMVQRRIKALQAHFEESGEADLSAERTERHLEEKQEAIVRIKVEHAKVTTDLRVTISMLEMGEGAKSKVELAAAIDQLKSQLNAEKVFWSRRWLQEQERKQVEIAAAIKTAGEEKYTSVAKMKQDILSKDLDIEQLGKQVQILTRVLNNAKSQLDRAESNEGVLKSSVSHLYASQCSRDAGVQTPAVQIRDLGRPRAKVGLRDGYVTKVAYHNHANSSTVD